ncbi:MAG: hypothetical protein WDO69_32565 [Pseudomonadota bacterium]
MHLPDVFENQPMGYLPSCAVTVHGDDLPVPYLSFGDATAHQRI